MASFIGPALVLAFCVSQAFRDVYFGHVFQKVDFFLVIVIAFVLSTALFTTVAVVRTPGAFGKLRGHGRTVLAVNLTTALAWSSYFFGLTHIEPSIVNTLHSGMGPLTVVALAAFGVPLAQTGAVRGTEYLGYSGMALSLIGLWWVVLADASGVAGVSHTTNLAGLALLLVSGASITVSLLYCKRLHDAGINAEVVSAVRYLALIALAGAIVAGRGRMPDIAVGQFGTLAFLTTVLIVLPLYALQLGIARTAPLTANVLRALGPVFIFALEQFDGRMTYSAPALVCILFYSASAIVCNVTHGWRASSPEGLRPLTSAR